MNKETETKFYLYFVVSAVNLASFICGTCFAWTSPVLPKLNGKVDPDINPIPYNISLEEESWITSLLMLSTSLVPFAGGCIAESIGRKKALLISMIPILASFSIFTFASDVIYFYTARLLGGVGIGIIFAVLPLYVGELSQDFNRGTLGCFMGIFVTSGNLFSYCLGPYLTVENFNLLALLPPFLFIILMAFVPESPYYYIGKSMEKSAEESLEKIRHERVVHSEILKIKKNVEESTQERVNIRDVFKSGCLVKGLIITLGLMFFQQFSGYSIVLVYMQSIFDATGRELPPEISTVIVGVIQVLTCSVTSLVVDRWGRRILLLSSISGSGLSLIFIGLYFNLLSKGGDVTSIFWLPIFSLIVYVISFNVGLGPLPVVIIGELFPSNVKSMASGLTISLCFFLAFCATKFFPSLSAVLGMANSFWLFSGFCALGFCYIWMFVPETKGKSFCEIQLLLKGK